MSRQMTDSEKLDYLIELVEALQTTVDENTETLEKHTERLSDLSSDFGDGFQYETQ